MVIRQKRNSRWVTIQLDDRSELIMTGYAAMKIAYMDREELERLRKALQDFDNQKIISTYEDA